MGGAAVPKVAGTTPSEPAAHPCSFCGPVFGSPLQVASPAPTLCLRLAHKPLWVCCPESTPWELPNAGVSTGRVWQEESPQNECGDATPPGNPSQAGMPAGRGGSRLVERQRSDRRAREGAPRIARWPVGVRCLPGNGSFSLQKGALPPWKESVLSSCLTPR